MKKTNAFTVMQSIGILAIVAVVIWLFSSRQEKKAANTDKYLMDLAIVSEELASLKDYCSDAIKYEGYEDLCISLNHAVEKCDELQKLVDGAYEYFSPKDVE